MANYDEILKQSNRPNWCTAPPAITCEGPTCPTTCFFFAKNLSGSKKVINTDVKTKAENWPKFEKMIRGQFEEGGNKYALSDDKEITDWVCEFVPGETGCDWVLGTIAKYLGRFKNFRREKDLLKISTYAFLIWLKMGFHLQENHDEDIFRNERNGKTKP